VLITKFDKAEKIGLFGLGNQSIRFYQFHNKIIEEAKLKDLKIQKCLKHEKGKGIQQGANPCVNGQI
jgi:hypothetical protein